MSDKIGLRIVRSFADSSERLGNSVGAGCIIAALLGTALENAALGDAYRGAIAFLGMSFAANAFKTILDTLIANADEAKEQ
ncbi:hypothetical protein [Kushneria indalinina]|uniref:Uncharacterized protein n=1 Tax=Kushneria indalinina DSM 14324 TaxID=1122140 RepID=A0A3D9DRN7_9GAMM|nr:hypothetical protein [Kushneria indalinina]REC93346.1 hypothetical protein C8D72_3390 [Kushneria indalinina DSM 14324]